MESRKTKQKEFMKVPNQKRKKRMARERIRRNQLSIQARWRKQ